MKGSLAEGIMALVDDKGLLSFQLHLEYGGPPLSKMKAQMGLPALSHSSALLPEWLTQGKELSIKDDLFADGQLNSRVVYVHSVSHVCSVTLSKNNLDDRFYGKIQTSGVINNL